MAGWITQVEDAILDRARELLGKHVRAYDSVGGSWTADMLRRALQESPGVYCAFMGGRRIRERNLFEANFDIYTVTQNSRGEKYRRRGDGQSIGAYEILDFLVSGLNEETVAGAGCLVTDQVRNLFQEAMLDLGGTVYAITVKVNIDLEYEADPSGLDDFKIFHADYDLDPDSDAEPMHDDTVNLTDNS